MTMIWKFSLDAPGPVIAVMMPEGARVLSVQMQAGRPQMWAAVNTEAPEVTRLFRVVGTGMQLPAVSDYIGTIQSPPFVWHVFECAP